MIHQLHCVEKTRLGLNDPMDPIATLPHLQHCMNLLRQVTLCAADLTLEPAVVDPATNDIIATGVGVEHTCKDHSAVFEFVEENYDRWTEYWETVKDTVPGADYDER